MRQIKFKGMDLRGNWHHGLLSIVTVGKHQGSFISNSGGIPLAFDVRPETVGQFTGIKDRGGNDVYEGDEIEIEWKSDISVETISYDEEFGYFKYGNNPICELSDPPTPFLVVGNIYNYV